MPKRVLIADDNESVRRVLRSLLDQQPGLEVCAVTRDGIEVTSVVKSSLPAAKILLFHHVR